MVLRPTVFVRRVTEITPQLLERLEIKALVLDVDNTLTHDNSQSLLPQVTAWLDEMRALGMKLLILSNNSPERVAPFAAQYGLEFEAAAKKPLPGGLGRAAAHVGVPPQQLLMVGDQLFTDILAANLFGCPSVLVEPYHREKHLFFRLKRALETPFLCYWRRSGKMNEGKP